MYMKHDDVPDNFIAAGFNYVDENVYSLLNTLGQSIGQPFRLLKYYYLKDTSNTNLPLDYPPYAVFYTKIDYFNTHIFLLKNFSAIEESNNSLFNQQMGLTMQYLLPFKSQPQKMYILSAYSDEIKNIKDLSRLFKLETLNIKLSFISSKKILKTLHYSFEDFLEINDD